MSSLPSLHKKVVVDDQLLNVSLPLDQNLKNSSIHTDRYFFFYNLKKYD